MVFLKRGTGIDSPCIPAADREKMVQIVHNISFAFLPGPMSSSSSSSSAMDVVDSSTTTSASSAKTVSFAGMKLLHHKF